MFRALISFCLIAILAASALAAIGGSLILLSSSRAQQA